MLSCVVCLVTLLLLVRYSQAGCEKNSFGVGDSRITYSQFTASSSNETARYGRLNSNISWCATDDDRNPYLQIDLGVKGILCAVSTQGDAQGDRWVETYHLQSSEDGVVWKKYSINGVYKIINGNSNSRTAVKRILLQSFSGRYIRFIPKDFYGARCMRVEIFGNQVVQSNSAIGVADPSSIPDLLFSASSEYDSRYKASNARLNKPFGWAPNSGDVNSAYLQIDLGTVRSIYAIATQGHGGYDGKGQDDKEWVTSYKLKFSLDDTVWAFYREGPAIQVFKGNVNSYSIVKNVLPTSVLALAVRIFPVQYVLHPTLRVELYNIPFPPVESSTAYGLSDPTVFPDSRFSASSHYDSRYKASKARLNKPFGWAPGTSDKDSAYLQIDLGTVRSIYAIATQGHGGYDGKGQDDKEWVTSYKLKFSLDKSVWNFYKEGSRVKVFQGNKDANSTVTNLLKIKTTTRAIRIYPITYELHPTLRVELYDAPTHRKVCSAIPLGLANVTAVPDYRFSASSYEADKMPYLARLLGDKGWIPLTSDKDWSYLKIDLGAVYVVCAIATQGYNGSGNYWVTKYQLQLSLDGEHWQFNKTYQGNHDNTSVVKNFVNPPTQAKFIQMKPVAFNIYPALRIEAFGSIRESLSPFGLESNIVPDSQLTSSSERNSNHSAKEARLYNTRMWCAGENGKSEYLQVDLGNVVTVTGLATQGSVNGEDWVETYSISYSNDERSWKTIGTALSAKIFKGNSNVTGVYASWFDSSLAARFLRILPQTFENVICLRAEVYGSTFVELPVVRPGLKNQILQKEPNSSVVMTCNIFQPSSVMRVVWLLNGTDISNSTSIVTIEPKITFISPIITRLALPYGNAALARSKFNCRKISKSESTMICLPLEVECRVLVTTGVNVSSSALISLYNSSLALPGRPDAPALQSRGENFLNISWPRVDPGDGKMISYTVRYTNTKDGSKNKIKVKSGLQQRNLTVVISGLQPFTQYFVWVRAFSSIGAGLPSKNISFVTGLSPSMNFSPKVQTVTLGVNETFTPLRCSGRGFPLPKLLWKRNGLIISTTSQLSLRTQKLSDINITSEIDLKPGGLNVYEGGNYTCEVQSGLDSEGQSSATLQVFFLPKVFYIKSKKVFRRGATNQNLTCVGQGYPTPTVYWTKKNKTIDIVTFNKLEIYSNEVVQVISHGTSSIASSVLYLRTSGMTYQEAGNYTCVVFNDHGVGHSVWTRVEVLFYPEFTSTPTNHVVLQGSDVTFNCSAIGVPFPSIRWLFSGTNMATSTYNQRALTLYSVKNTPNCEGNYTCIAESRAGSDSVLVNLLVVVPPTITSTTANQTLLLYEMLKLECKATGEPVPVVNWIKDGVKKSNSSVLTIEKVRLRDIGRYQCLARNRAGIITASVWVDVQAHSRIYVSPQLTSILVKQQENFTIICYGNGFPKPSVYWMRNNVMIPSLESLSEKDRKRNVQVVTGISSPLQNVTAHLFLRVVGVTYNEAGNYTCVANNTVKGKNSFTKQTVEVLFKPEFAITPKPLVLLEAQSARFNCSATGMPPPRLEWSFSHGKLPYHKMLGTDLLIESVQRSPNYEGVYTCTAISRAGTVNTSAGLVVHAAVSITDIPESAYRPLGSAVTLNCSARGFPLPAIKWRKAELEITSNKHTMISTKLEASSVLVKSVLYINKIIRNDTANYTCIASNIINKVQTKTTVVVLEKPDTLKTRLLTVTDKEMSLSWTLVFNGNLPIKWFSVSYNSSEVSNVYKLSSDKYQTTISGLKAFTQYTVSVTANNQMGESEPAVLMVKTRGSLPESPRNVSTAGIGSRSFEVIWIFPLTTNGKINHYVIFYWPSSGNVSTEKSVTVRPPQTSTMITGLKPYTNYSCRVQAFTIVGGGSLSFPVVYAQTKEDAPSSPWQLEVKEVDAFTVTVQWRRPQILNGVLRGYTVSLHNKDESLRNRNVSLVTADPVVLKIKELEPFTSYWIKVRAFTVKYSNNSKEIRVITSESVPGEPSGVGVTSTKELSYIVTWKTPKKPNGIIIRYVIYFEVEQHAGLDRPKNKIFHTENNITELSIASEKLNGATTYVIRVSGETKAGEGKKSSDKTKLKTKLSKPPLPVMPLLLNQTENTAMLEIPKFSEVNGNIRYYKIYVTVFPTMYDEGSVKNLEIVSWKSVYSKVEQLKRPFAYLTFQFKGDKYNEYRFFTVGDEAIGRKRRRRRQEEKEYKNLKLEPDRKYEIFVRGYVSDNLYTESKPAPISTKLPRISKQIGGSGTSTSTIVVVVVVVLIVVAILIMVGVYLKRKKNMAFNKGRANSIGLKPLPAAEWGVNPESRKSDNRNLRHSSKQDKKPIPRHQNFYW